MSAPWPNFGYFIVHVFDLCAQEDFDKAAEEAKSLPDSTSNSDKVGGKRGWPSYGDTAAVGKCLCCVYQAPGRFGRMRLALFLQLVAPGG